MSNQNERHASNTRPARARSGMAALANAGENDEFSVIAAIGGVRGVVESMLPGLLFVVLFICTSDLRMTVIASAALAVVQVVVRLIQRQSNAAYIVLLLVSMAVRVPGLGFLVEFIRSLPTEHFKAWLSGWRSDRALYKAYARITWLWIGLFALRLIVQVPLYMTNQVGWLGTTRLVMGIPFWALAIWISYLIVADPLHRHRMLEKGRESTSTEGGDAHPTAQ
mgnify:CR=1 FL=1